MLLPFLDLVILFHTTGIQLVSLSHTKSTNTQAKMQPSTVFRSLLSGQRLRFFASLVGFLFIVSSLAVAITTTTTTTDESQKNDTTTTTTATTASSSSETSSSDCGLYLALSSTSSSSSTTTTTTSTASQQQQQNDNNNNVKWGIYTAKAIPANTVIGYPEIGIVSHNFKGNNYLSHDDDDVDNTNDNTNTAVDHEDRLQTIVDWVEEMIWVAASAGGKFELPAGGGRAVAAIPGAGVLAAFHPKLTNADWDTRLTYNAGTTTTTTAVAGEVASTTTGEAAEQQWGTIETTTTTTAGVSHSNRGAVSPFFHATIQSTTDIVAGSELFLDYGENWAAEEQEDELTPEDFERIDQTVDQMMRFFEKHKESLDDDNDDEHDEHHAKQRIYEFITQDVMKAAVGPNKAQRIAAVLPKQPDDLSQIKTVGGALKYSEPESTRSLEWLQKYGMCIDNIKPGPSTIPHAGRGAFATRPIPKGGLIAPVPLLHIPDVEVLDMHPLKIWEDDEYMRESDNVIHQQLMLNYVYGHPESRMVLFPTAPTVSFINHSDDDYDDNSNNNKPNAKMVWSEHHLNERHWFDLDPLDLLNEENLHLGLLMEIVATRDIQPNEEIFLDYGPEWKAAWKEHQEAWEKRVKDGEIPHEWPLRAVDMMGQYRANVFKTEEELKTEPYPENVILKAFLTVPEDADNIEGTLEDPKPWGGNKPYSHSNIRDCMIIKRERVPDSDKAMPYEYLVRWTSSDEEETETYVKGVPHEAFVFVDAPLMGDQFFEGSFRHYIGIPDEIFPKAWRNIRSDDGKSTE